MAADLKCTGCVSASELLIDGDIDMKGHTLTAKKVSATELLGTTVTAGAFVGDGSKLTGITMPQGACKTGEVVTGVKADGTLVCGKADRIPVLPKAAGTCTAELAGYRFYDKSDASLKVCDGADWRRLPADPLCGNKVVNSEETCDDGNQVDGDGCTAKCQKNVCGDGVLHKGVEQCDDKNKKDGDGCDKTCKLEVFSSCLDALAKGQKTDGQYKIKPVGSSHTVTVWCDQSNGGWMLLMTLTASSAYTYGHKVWTQSDDTTGKVPLLTTDADAVSRLFYHFPATQTRLCMHKYDQKSTVVCDQFSHAGKTGRNLAAGPVMGSSYGTGGKLSATWRSVAAGGKWGANRWHRWGWAHGKSGCYGLRVGFSADNDSSDSRDAGIGMGVGVIGGGCGTVLSTGSGYFHYPGWQPQPSPLKAGLRSYIWMK